MQQQTLAGSIQCDGIGLHSGKPVSLRLMPAPPDSGVRFVRTDLPGQPQVAARAELVTSVLRATTLTDGEVTVYTIEHLLSALHMLGVDNCLVEMNAPEPPVMDGSAKDFADLILQVGRVTQAAERKEVRLQEAVTVREPDRFIVILPYDGLRVSYTSVNPHPLLGVQYIDLELDEESFLREIAPARTIGFLHEVEALKAKGLGLGGTLENVVVYSEDAVLTPLRYPDELVRHKVLDILGDLFLAGPIRGHIIAVKSSHALNTALAKQIVAKIRSEKGCCM